jgi:glycerol-3-phosphate dehydrogenase (NAD(P)+)
MLKISIIGTGAWGVALSMVAHRAGASVTLIGHRSDTVADLEKNRHIKAFPHISIPKDIKLTLSLENVRGADILIIAIPAQKMRALLGTLKSILSHKTILLIASKGIEQGTGLLMSEVADEVLGARPLCILSGPNFAHEVAENLPTATAVGYRGQMDTAKILRGLSHKNFRIYLNEDTIGVQVAGAVKNVLAIACGIARSQELGDNAVASLISRGLEEIARLGVAKGAHLKTFLGLSGVGDVVLTCGGTHSRNFKFGFRMGKEKRHLPGFGALGTTVEGVSTVEALRELAQKLKVEMPISEMVYKILYGGASISQAIEALLSRPPEKE